MKQIFRSIAVILFAVTTTFSQNFALQSFVDKYKNDEAFSYAFLSKDMFEVAVQSDIKDTDWKRVHQVVQNIGSLTVLAADSISFGPDLYKEALNAIPTGDFAELLAVQDGADRVKIWVGESESVLTDLLMLVGTSDAFVLVRFAGNLELNNLSALAGLFDAESAAQLAKTSESIAADFAISPNPSSGKFSINYVFPEDAPDQLSIMDQNGRQLIEMNMSGEATQVISAPTLPTGLYWVQLKTKQGKVGVKQLQIMKMP